MLVAVCDGTLEPQVDGSIECVGVWLTASHVAPFDPSSLDVAALGALFGAGFSIVMVFWLVGWTARVFYQAVSDVRF